MRTDSISSQNRIQKTWLALTVAGAPLTIVLWGGRVEQSRAERSRVEERRGEERRAEHAVEHVVEHAGSGACITAAAWDWVRVRDRLGVE